MLRFGCTNCKAVLKVRDDQVNTKVACVVCGQRLLVPPPEPPVNDNKTVMGFNLNPAAQGPGALPSFPAAAANAPKVPAAHPATAAQARPRPAQRSPGMATIVVAMAVVAFVVLGGVVAGSAFLWFHLSSSPQPSTEIAKAAEKEHKAVIPGPTPRPRPDEPTGDGRKEPAEKKDGDAPAKSKADTDKKEPPARLTGQQLYEKTLKSTVWINNPGIGFGTGILIHAEGKLVLTNYHVVFRPATLAGVDILDLFEDKLDPSDPWLRNKNVPHKAYEMTLSRDVSYQLDMVSEQIEPYLVVTDARDNQLAASDERGGNRSTRLRFNPPADGKYRILAAALGTRLGSFKLIVSQAAGKNAPPNTGKNVASSVLVSFPDYKGSQVITSQAHYQKLMRADRDKYLAKVVAWDAAKDLAIVKLSSIPQGFPALPLAKESGQPGQMVHSIGNPGGSGSLWVYTSGTVRTAPYEKKWQSMLGSTVASFNAWIIETQSPTNPGDSGGPLVNDMGQLVAVTQGVSLKANSINLFIDVREVRTFCQANGFRWREE